MFGEPEAMRAPGWISALKGRAFKCAVRALYFVITNGLVARNLLSSAICDSPALIHPAANLSAGSPGLHSVIKPDNHGEGCGFPIVKFPLPPVV